MKITDGYFLTAEADDRTDIINNLLDYAKKTFKSYLFCYIDGILNSNNDVNIIKAKEYLSIVLTEYPDLLSIFLDSGYALIEFDNPFYAMDFREIYFLCKDEVDISEKYVYCCVVDQLGAIYFENIKAPKTESPVRLKDVFTEKELNEIMLQSEIAQNEADAIN